MHITYGHVDPLKCVLENMCFIYWVLFGTQRELFGGGGRGIRVGALWVQFVRQKLTNICLR